MSLRAILYAYVLGGLTFIPLVILGVCFYAIYTSVPVDSLGVRYGAQKKIAEGEHDGDEEPSEEDVSSTSTPPQPDVNDIPKTRKAWLTVRRTFEETAVDATYVGLVRNFLDARSKDPKRSRPKDMWYVVLKGKVLYLYEDESMTECEAAIELGSHEVVIFPEDLLDGELFTKRNAICLKPKAPQQDDAMASVTKEMLTTPDFEEQLVADDASAKQKRKQEAKAQELEKKFEEAKQEAFDPSTPWFIFVRSPVEMEDWYLSLVHASDFPPNKPTLTPLLPIFRPADMLHLVETLDEQPDVIPMRWLNALIGRLFFSYYRTQTLESYIIGRLMRKLSKIKRPSFLTEIAVREVSVGDKPPMFSKPMLKELTKEGDAALEVHLSFKGEVRITIDAIATITLGSRFKSYTVKLVLAAVLRELEGNLLIKLKRPPSSRIWYAFTQMPRMVLDVEPVVSDRQITWSMILGTIESRLKEVILESVVMPNMDDIAFFESSLYKHRGGIWADASREEHRPADLLRTTPDGSEEDRVPVSAPASFPPSAPSSSPPSGTPTPVATDLEGTNLHRTHSAPSDQAASSSSPELDGITMPRSATTSGLTATASINGTAARRRTWFSGIQNGDAEASAGNVTANGGYPDAVERGRTLASDSHMRRSSSTPNAVSQESELETPRPTQDDSPSGSHLSTIPIKRSSSQHSHASSSQDTSASSSLDNASSGGPAESLFSSFRSKSPATSEKALPTASPTTTFFQTLKTRDKQAISNSAKEAMRKWGVNWGGLKKTDHKPADEGGDAEQKMEAESKEQKARSQYAEVRAAVEHRKVEGTLAPAFEPSEAIAVPRKSQSSQRAPSVSSAHGSLTGSAAGSTISTSTSPRAGGLDVQASPRAESPALPPPVSRTRTVSHVSQPGDVTHNLQTTLPPDEEEHPVQPIHTQPLPPKTMTIPGIHASHRGEVMSMGYAPPPPPPSEQKKAPAIQSVYRLWKNPATQQSPSPSPASSAESQPEMQIGFTGRDQDDAAGQSQGSEQPPTSAPAAPALPARPVPPPLPPRSHSTNALQLASEPPRHPPGVGSSSPPASAALLSIVSKDNSVRASMEPSTPPRRQEFAQEQQTPSSSSTVSIAVSDADEVVAKPKPPALPPRRPPAQQPAV